MAAAETLDTGSIEEALLPPSEQAQKAQEAAAAIAELRKAIGKFNAERAKTREMVEGRRKSKYGSVMAAESITASRRRMAPRERQAVTGLRDLLRLILSREPQPAEMAAIPEPDTESLGVLPLLPLAAIAGGAWTLTTLFNWLTQQELTAQREAGMTHTWSEVAGQALPWVGPLLLAGAVGLGGYALYREVKGESVLGGVKGLFGKAKKSKQREEDED